ncbi:MAG: hypothetical protein ACLVL7_09060 [Anaerotruncus massiliensis (ex Togo et al. 2019)]
MTDWTAFPASTGVTVKVRASPSVTASAFWRGAPPLPTATEAPVAAEESTATGAEAVYADSMTMPFRSSARTV